MYAVIKAGGHQYRVAQGDQITIDRIDGNVGDKLKFDQVLMLGSDNNQNIGTPMVAGASVEAVIKEQTRGEKILVFKYRRRKNSKNARSSSTVYSGRN